tara:strand:+ start:3800 stop:4114 length:315 start_codon:yes stop_codon:yes gene_type:complete
MIRLLSIPLLTLASFAFVGCAVDDEVRMGGVPGWVSKGARIGPEPAPLAPDPEMIYYREESGPVEFFLATDKRVQQEAFVKRNKKIEPIEYESGRDSRINRLFR